MSKEKEWHKKYRESILLSDKEITVGDISRTEELVKEYGWEVEQE